MDIGEAEGLRMGLRGVLGLSADVGIGEIIKGHRPTLVYTSVHGSYRERSDAEISDRPERYVRGWPRASAHR